MLDEQNAILHSSVAVVGCPGYSWVSHHDHPFCKCGTMTWQSDDFLPFCCSVALRRIGRACPEKKMKRSFSRGFCFCCAGLLTSQFVNEAKNLDFSACQACITTHVQAWQIFVDGWRDWQHWLVLLLSFSRSWIEWLSLSVPTLMRSFGSWIPRHERPRNTPWGCRLLHETIMTA